MKINQQVGSKETILFSPEVIVSEEGLVTISPHTVYIRGKRFELEAQSFDNPESVWFNWENHSLQEKEFKPGAFKFLDKSEGGEYCLIQYVEPSPVIETPIKTSIVEAVPETIQTAEASVEGPLNFLEEQEIRKTIVVKPKFIEKVKKFLRRK